MIEYQTTVNQGNSHQDRRLVANRNEIRLLSQQLLHQGLEPSFKLFPYGFFRFGYIQKM